MTIIRHIVVQYRGNKLISWNVIGIEKKETFCEEIHLFKIYCWHAVRVQSLFVNLPFRQLAFLSTCLFVNLPFCQLAILSTCLFVNLPFRQLAFLSTGLFVNLPFCQLAILSTCLFVHKHEMFSVSEKDEGEWELLHSLSKWVYKLKIQLNSSWNGDMSYDQCVISSTA
jgi:hypothetical protein